MKTKHLNREQLPSFFNAITQAGKIVIAPSRIGDKIYFTKVDSWEQVDLDFISSTLSAKAALFPRWEPLLQFSGDGKMMTVKDTEIPDTETVIFGLHPCDTGAFNYMGEFFEGGITDTYIQKRRSRITLITLSCKKADDACFCTSVGISPGASQGSDLMLTEMEDGNYYVEVLTDKGENLTASARDIFQDYAVTDKTPYLAEVPLKFDLTPIQEKLGNSYDSPLWINQSLPCLGCGACAFVCPTCTCFDIQDEGDAYAGTRLRCWDSCGFSLFTLHASGHNPRPVQSHRWRQRIMHKFIYSKSDDGTGSCVGCGRCLRICPAQMSITDQLQSFAEVK